jgi:YggT family protein
MFIVGHLFLAIGKLLSFAVDIMILLIVIRAVLSWFSVSPYSQAVRFLIVITNPVLEPIRRILPPMGLDISPLIAIFGLLFVRWFLASALINMGRHLL